MKLMSEEKLLELLTEAYIEGQDHAEQVITSGQPEMWTPDLQVEHRTEILQRLIQNV